MNEPRLVVLLSGSGSTLQNLIDRIADGRLPGRIVGVISSKLDVLGVERAKKAHLPLEIIPASPKTTLTDRLWPVVRSWSPDLVVLAGWIHLLPIPEDFHRRVINVHPSLLPAYGGKGMYGHHVHEAVLANGEMTSGCTVHYVDDTYDTGPAILQRTVPVHPGDTPASLAERVQAAEREALPEAIRGLIGNMSRSASPRG